MNDIIIGFLIGFIGTFIVGGLVWLFIWAYRNNHQQESSTEPIANPADENKIPAGVG